MKYCFTFFVLANVFAATAQTSSYAVSDIMLNTFKIKTTKGTATAFVVMFQNSPYLVTARHTFPNTTKYGEQVSFHILYDSVYSKYNGKIRFHKDTSVDIAIMAVDNFKPKLTPFPLTHEIGLGQEVLFFGFPYNTFYTRAFGHSLPFIKHATISAIGDDTFFLDGINNPGFSGGPIVVRDSEQRLCIAGVVTAYHPEYNFIEDVDKKKSDSLKYHFNSGIIYAHPRKQIEEVLQRTD